MPYQTFTNGTSLTAEAVQAIENETVHVFDNTSQRDSQITAPAEGMVCYLKTTKRLYVYDAGWKDAIAYTGPNTKVHKSDAGYPVTAAGISAETVIDRITIPSANYAREIMVSANTWMSGSAAGVKGDLVLYAGSTILGTGRITMASSSENNVGANGSHSLAANAGVVIEARVRRPSGAGTLNTSISGMLTVTNVLAVRA